MWPIGYYNEKPEQWLSLSFRTVRLLSWMWLADQPLMCFCRLSSSAWSYLSWIATRRPTWWTVLFLFVRSGCPVTEVLHRSTLRPIMSHHQRVCRAILSCKKTAYATTPVAPAINRKNKRGFCATFSLCHLFHELGAKHFEIVPHSFLFEPLHL